ncbi:MAG: PQQ-like beta-propeller repeat protein [Candidatus Poribacteria bacterium]|nr:PQQ-like beta-propeller repeat protein [Candidatus Poribacteria bacterium]
MKFRGLSVALALAAVSWSANAGDWSQWRGPNQDGISTETVTWSKGVPVELWRVPLGEGFSGISVVGNKAFTMYAVGNDEFAASFDITTGKEVWKRRTDAKFPDHQGGNGPRSTPHIDGGIAYVMTAYGKVYALNTTNGDVKWMHDLREEFGGRVPNWGYSGSVLVDGNVVYAEAGGARNKAFIAFDKTTGDVKWTTHTDEASYSTPAMMTIAGTRQLVFYSASGLVGVNPSDGNVLWTYQWINGAKVNAAMPALIGADKLYISAGYDKGAAFVQIEKTGNRFKATELRTDRVMKIRMASPIVHEGYLYGFDGGTLKCIDPMTGDEKWAERGFGEGSLMLAGGDLIVFGDKGQLAVAPISPKGFTQRVSATVMNASKTWTVPTLADGKLYLRNQSELICLIVGEGAKANRTPSQPF